MYFKNMHLFKLNNEFDYSPEDLHEKLYMKRAKPCGKLDLFTLGWTEPLGEHGNLLTHACPGYMMLTAKHQSKVLPASVVRDQVNAKAAEIEKTEHRKVSAKQKTALREEVLFQLLPQAFVQSTTTNAYIDTQGGWFIVDAASRAKAEELTVLLRDTLGSFKISPPEVGKDLSRQLSNWVFDSALPNEFILGNTCEMFDPMQQGRTIKFNNFELETKEVLAHLKAGKLIQKLALCWQDRISFIIESDLSIKRIRFHEIIQEQSQDITADNEIEKFDVEFAIMTAELTAFWQDLATALNVQNITQAALAET